MPAVHTYFKIAEKGTASHTLEFAAAADTDYAYGQMMKAAQAMAQAGLRLFTDGDFRQQVDEEFETQVKNRH